MQIHHYSRTVALNFFRALAHFEEPQITVAHFDFICDVMMTKLLGLASEVMVAEMIFKRKKKFIATPVPRMASLRAKLDLIYKVK